MLASSSSYALLGSAQAFFLATKLWFTVFGHQPYKPKPLDFPTKTIFPPTPSAFQVPVAAFPFVFILGCMFSACLGALACFSRGKGRGLVITSVLLPLAVFKRLPVELAPIAINPWYPAGFVFNSIRRHFAAHGIQYGHALVVGATSHLFWMLATVVACEVWRHTEYLHPYDLVRSIVGDIPLLLVAFALRNKIMHALWSYYLFYSHSSRLFTVQKIHEVLISVTDCLSPPPGWTSMEISFVVLPACLHLTALWVFLCISALIKILQAARHFRRLQQHYQSAAFLVKYACWESFLRATVICFQATLALILPLNDLGVKPWTILLSSEVRAKLRKLLDLMEIALPAFQTAQRESFSYLLLERRQAFMGLWQTSWGRLSLLQKLVVLIPIIIFHWHYTIKPLKPHYRIWVRRWRRRLAPLFR